MSATSRPAVSRPAVSRPVVFRLVVFRLRRDRVQLAIWTASTGLLALVSATGVAATYGDDAERAGIMRLAVANPVILLLRGLPQGTSLPQFVFFQIFTYLALLAALMSTFLAVRHSRTEEESGRAELVEATPAGRLAPTAATVVHGVLANLVLGVAVAAGFVAGGLPVAGSVASGVAAACVGVAFVGVGLLAAQFARTGRGANTLSVAAVMLAFVLRGIGDAVGRPSADGESMTSAWPSWLSPIGWAQHVAAFSRDSYAPLLLCLALGAVCVGAVSALQTRRDSGASLLAARPARATARDTLRGTFALGWRLQWPTILAWVLGGAACGLLAGSLADLVESAAATNPALTETLRAVSSGNDGSVRQVLVSTMFTIAGVVAAACGVQAVIRLRQEEAGGTAELLLAAPVARVRWLADYLLLGAVAIALVLLAAAVAFSAAAAAIGSDDFMDAWGSALAQAPAALLYLAIVALVFVLLPAATIAVGWVLLAAGLMLGVFGALVGAPEWARDLSPFSHTPTIGSGAVDWSGGVWMLAAAVVVASIVLALMRRRELRG